MAHYVLATDDRTVLAATVEGRPVLQRLEDALNYGSGSEWREL